MAALIIFLAATQWGLHFWPNAALVYGIRVDYLSPTLYFLDALILCYLGLAFRSLRDFRQVIGTFAGLFPVLITNLIFSQNPLATLSWSLHLLLCVLFIFSLPKNYFLNSRFFTTPLLLALLFQTLLALTQVIIGHSVGGLLYYFGERMVSVGSPNIASASFMGQVVLRAYGTFSHPNILAGWSVIILLIILQLALEFRSSRDFRRARLAARQVIGTFAIILTTLIVFLTQSRAAALSLFGVIIPFCVLKNLRAKIIYVSTLLLCFFVLLPHLTPSRSDLSLSERLDLQTVSTRVIAAYPVFGSGAQSSITTYPLVSPTTRLLQPDHDSLTLLLSWFGIFGVLAMVYAVRSHRALLIYFLLPLAPLLLLDHYLPTSPQGIFILLLYLRVTMRYES